MLYSFYTFENNTNRANRRPTWPTFQAYLERAYWGKDNFITRRLCGVSCVYADVVTETHYRKAEQHLRQFDLVTTLDAIGRNEMDPWCALDATWCRLTRRLQRRDQPRKRSGVHEWLDSPASAPHRGKVAFLTKYDAKLYLVAREIHEKTMASVATPGK